MAFLRVSEETERKKEREISHIDLCLITKTLLVCLGYSKADDSNKKQSDTTQLPTAASTVPSIATTSMDDHLLEATMDHSKSGTINLEHSVQQSRDFYASMGLGVAQDASS